MAVFSINAFRTALAGGSRPNLFRFTFGTLPSGVSLPGADILIKAGALPGYTVGVIEVPFRGRRIKVPGDRTFAEWTVTVINNESQTIRKGFEDYMSYIASNDFSNANLRSGSGVDYTTTITVDQLNDSGNTSKTTTLFQAFPTDVSSIDLSYDTTDAVEEFTVTFQYNYSN